MTAHSVWLLPESQAAEQFSSEIARIAAVSEGTVFQPHVTLLGDLTGPVAQTENLCRSTVGDMPPIRATVTGVATLPNFFMSLFLDLELDPDLNEVRAQIAHAAALEPATVFRPHLSLAYGLDQEAAQSQKSILTDRWPNGTDFLINRVAIVNSAKHVPISDWKILSSFALARGG